MSNPHASLQPRLPRRLALKIMTMADANHDGYIELDEFTKLVRRETLLLTFDYEWQRLTIQKCVFAQAKALHVDP